MQIAIVAADFSPDEADKLRRAMATFRHTGTIHTFREKFIAGMVKNGYGRDFAERCFKQIEGFGEYGFPESHAASFALLVYVSAWIKWHYPDVFCAAILNSQPMGFYQPAQLVRDAREHGVEMRPPDVNLSDWDCTLEPAGDGSAHRCAVRLGLRLVDGLAEAQAKAIVGRARPGLCRPARRSGSAAARRSPRSSGWRRPTLSARSGSIGARRCGRSKGWRAALSGARPPAPHLPPIRS